MLTAAVRSAALTLAGFASLIVAAFAWHPIAGWVAVGLALPAVEFLTSPQAQQCMRQHDRHRR